MSYIIKWYFILFIFFNLNIKRFIDFNGLAVVNISGNTVKKIYNEIATYPTIGIFDDAKNEIVENMYRSIYPILLQNNKKYLDSTLC